LVQDLSPPSNCSPAQVSSAPAVGLDFSLKKRWTLVERSAEPSAFNARRISPATDTGVMIRFVIYLQERCPQA